MDNEVTQTRQVALPMFWRVRMSSAPFDHLWDFPPMLTTPPASLPPIFWTLTGVDPNSKEFLPILGLFLQNKEERKLLVQLEGSATVYVADTLDKVCDHRVGSGIP